MSTRVVRRIEDCLRHRMDVEIECACGYKAVLDADEVLRKFKAMRWSTSLEGACWLPSAHARFYCSRCGRRPVRVGPGTRG